MLNRYDRSLPMNGEAEMKYLDGDFRVVRPGAFVRCAVTGVPIPLEELKYWSVDRQEAYASPQAVLQRLAAYPPSRRAKSISAQRRSFATHQSCRERVRFLDHQRHRQHMRLARERRQQRLARHARAILFGGEQREAVVLGAHDQQAALPRAVKR